MRSPWLARSTGSARPRPRSTRHTRTGSSIATSSPANLLLDSDERIKVADFGVASAADLGSFTEAGTVVGTAGYLAPEQARGERATPASDLYALARRRLRALDGQAAVRARVLDRRGDRPRERADPAGVRLEPELPRELDDVLARGLAKEPEHRFGSAAELVEALREALDRAAGTTQVAAVPPVAAAGHAGAACRWRSCSCSWPARCSPASSRRPCSPATTARATAGTTAPQTVQETVTLPGTTVVQTVTTASGAAAGDRRPPTSRAPRRARPS